MDNLSLKISFVPCTLPGCIVHRDRRPIHITNSGREHSDPFIPCSCQDFVQLSNVVFPIRYNQECFG